MPKISRNAPCPCGSGLKYKKCCLAKLEKDEAQWAELDRAGIEVVNWLTEKYPDETRDAVTRGFFECLTPEQIDATGELPNGIQDMFSVNIGDWLTTEAETEVEGETIRLIDLALGPDGAPLSPEQREYLETVAEQPLGLYEVVEVKPNEGLWLVDTLNAESERFCVRDRTASRSVRLGEVLGARIVPVEPHIFSGSLYPFPRPQYPRIRKEVLDGPQGEDGRPHKNWVSEVIIREWLLSLFGPMPPILDFSGQPIAPTTVHFRIRDRKRFEKAVEDHPDVVRNEDGSWSRLEGDRSLYGIRRTKKTRLELFALTKDRVQEGESWLGEIAGDALEKISSEEHDLGSVWKDRLEDAPTRRTKKKEEFLESLSDEDRLTFFEQMYSRMYDNWADEPIPALGDKTPKEAAKSRQGLQDLAELIRTYEISEAHKAKAENRPPVSFDFLWDQVGLRRKDFVR
jgi:hypothetical protein